jgi:hypothetical protein
VNKRIKTLATEEGTTSIREEFAGLRDEIRNYKNDLIKLMFVLSVGYIEIIIAVVLLVK